MTQYILVKLHPGLPWLKRHSAIQSLFIRKTDLNLRKKLIKYYIWSIALCGAEIWTLRKVAHKHTGSFEIWCWRRVEKIIWTDRVKNEVLCRVKEYPTWNKKKEG
jgi:hypothetical protein